MEGLIHTALGKILGFLFPERCLGCRKEGTLLCKNCQAKSRKKHRPQSSLPFLDNLESWGSYQDKILRQALRRFKYHGTYGLAYPLSEMLHDLIKPHLSSFEKNAVVLPIPAFPRRKNLRGYNQAELLAQNLSEKISLPCRPEAILKIRNTPSQTSLRGLERILNVRDSFAVSDPQAVKNKTVLLVDDITTTGATLSEAARVLKESGAKKVIGLVVAEG